MNDFDFGSLTSAASDAKPTNPIEVFQSVPSLDGTPNDLWSGQSSALEQWHDDRDKKDVLVSLHTGAGKSLVGLIIAQSLVNEGVPNVIYACATNDLVLQTEKEVSSRLSFLCSTRAGGRFSNDNFENGTGFCITNYQALFNSRTKFRGDMRPGAIIFDDAHVADKIIRDCYTISISRRDLAAAFDEFITLITPYFRTMLRGEFLNAIVQGRSSYSCTALPPGLVVNLARTGTLNAWLKKYGIDESFEYGHLADKFQSCSIFLSRNGIEIAPAFLPSQRMDLLSSSEIRRVYLSATLTSEVDFCRAFGKRPSVKIDPANDAGVGERLILLRRRDQLKLNNSANPEFAEVAKVLAKENKVLIASSSYLAAKKYEELVKPPKKTEFSSKLNEFRNSTAPGAFALVARMDGIDLPNGTCRISVIDGLPTGFSLCEKYQFDCLEMRNAFAAKIANRLVQLFGRTNRGRNDYSVIFSFDDKIISWLNKNRNLALLPKLLRQQVELGKTVVEQFKIEKVEQLSPLAQQVLNRDQGWLSFYKNSISETKLTDEELQQAKEIDEKLLEGALAEASFAGHLWDGGYELAREALAPAVVDVASADRRLAGWYSVQIGHTYELQADPETASKHYADARSRTFNDIPLPRPSSVVSLAKGQEPNNNFHSKLLQIFASDKAVARNPWQKYHAQGAKILDDAGSSNQHEEAIRLLGEVLGFDSSRPEQESDTDSKLDVLWLHQESKKAILWSLKTKKEPGNLLNGKEIGTGHIHLAWFRKAYPEFEILNFVFLSPTSECVHTSHPDDDMWVVTMERIQSFYRVLDQAMINLFRMPPNERYPEIEAMSLRPEWSPGGIMNQLNPIQVCQKIR